MQIRRVTSYIKSSFRSVDNLRDHAGSLAADPSAADPSAVYNLRDHTVSLAADPSARYNLRDHTGSLAADPNGDLS